MATTQQAPEAPAATRSVWFGPVVSAAEERKFIRYLAADHGVAVCCWPRDAERVEHLAAAGVPRLLLIRAGCVPPAATSRQVCVSRSASPDEIHRALTSLRRAPACQERRSA